MCYILRSASIQLPLSCRQTELSSDVAQQYPARKCYTRTSQMRVQLQGWCWFPCSLFFPLGTSTLGREVTWALFHDEGQLLNLRDKFQILQIKGVKISAWSLHTQNGMRSGPVAVLFRCSKQFHTCLSEISGTRTALSTWAGVGCLYALSQHNSAK